MSPVSRGRKPKKTGSVAKATKRRQARVGRRDAALEALFASMPDDVRVWWAPSMAEVLGGPAR